MDGISNNNVVCCFCGESVTLKEAAILAVRPNIDSEETQQLFSHKHHLVEKMHKSVVLHPDFFTEEE